MKLIILLIAFPAILFALPPFFLTFTPPDGWFIADPSKVEENVQVGFVASKRKVFSPSITLSTEFIGDGVTLSTYVKAVKDLYLVNRTGHCCELGKINTSLGKTSLLKIDMQNQWGKICVVQAISLYVNYAIVQTAVCLREDWLKMQGTFLKTFESVAIYPSFLHSVNHPHLQHKIEMVHESWKKYISTANGDLKTLFTAPSFQDGQWKPLAQFIEKEFAGQGLCWQFLTLKYIQESLLEHVR